MKHSLKWTSLPVYKNMKHPLEIVAYLALLKITLVYAYIHIYCCVCISVYITICAHAYIYRYGAL